MTQLFIDGQEVVLSETFELELITENPYFTRRGEYTYDIDIDLKNTTNRKIYHNINRPDVTQTITNRSAVLLSGPIEIISGVEVILAVENNIAKIQIVAGNSQLNYEGGDNNIRNMKLDSIALTEEEAIKTLFGTYPQHQVVYTPIINNVNSEGKNELLNKVRVGEDILFTKEQSISPQYYLLYVIENLISKLGFSKGINELETDPLWSRIFIINPYDQTTPLQDLLPDWTINEFIEQIELYLNCIISIDKVSNTFNIVNMNKYFDSISMISIDEIVDNSVEKKFDVNTNYAFTYQKVAYDLPGSNQYNYIKLKDGIRQKCSIITSKKWTDFKRNYEEYYSGAFILHSEDYNLDYVVTDYPSAQGQQKGLIIVDRFKDAGKLDSRDKSLFQIVPLQTERIEIYSETGGTFLHGPAVKKLKNKSSSNAINDLINDSETKRDIPDRLYIGIYYGICKALNGGPDEHPGAYWNQMPMSSNDNYFMDKPSYNFGGQGILTLPNSSLVLDGNQGLFNRVYKNKRKINTSIEYRFLFLTNKVHQLNRIFIIQSKKYYCKEVRYKITSKGLDKIAEGFFYLAE